MRNFILSLFGIFFVASVQASPVDRGSVRVNTSAGFGYSRLSVASAHVDQFDLNIAADYFVVDHVSAGLLLGLQYQNADDGGSSVETTIFSFAPALGLSGYFGERVVPFIGIAPGLGHLNIDVGLGSASETKFLLQAMGGIDFLLTEMIALGISVSYQRLFSDPALWVISVPLRFSLYF